ncbi:ABC transporter ATP-binding protein [Desulfofustis limnaeus]|uniref:ABC transporter ATP-binding protein n=1 Tax=Desulfofustis limnaeus TaxID=2740163 RepID=UPI003F499DA0
MMNPVIEVRHLIKHFPLAGNFWGRQRAVLRAVDDVSLAIRPGETLGLVGESGSGKSTVGNCILRLVEPDRGEIYCQGQAVHSLKGNDLRRIRRRMQMVFQDPQSSLDPRMTVQTIVGYPLKLQRLAASSTEVAERVEHILTEVGLGREHLDRYPHEFSGGQRQRIGIARALITEPAFIIFDEPTSALDVSVQAQILNLIKTLQHRHGYAYLFISHDLTVVRHISHRVAVMYLGIFVESAAKGDLFEQPAHPYTRALLASAPKPNPDIRQELAVIAGDPPSPVHLPSGCRFHPRCPEAMPICRQKAPKTKNIGGDRADKLHRVCCHLY